MNLYLRYFNDETVVSSVEEAVDFLKGLNIVDFEIDDKFVGDLTEFVNSDSTYPKRYKVKQHYYFIVIKTNVQTIEEFKRNNIKSLLENDDNGSANKPSKSSPLSEELYGWYDAQLIFKRVISNPSTRKSSYKDTPFRAVVKAQSPLHCYDRIVDYLKSRDDIDARSQFPSARGRNFSFSYIGSTKPETI